MKICIIAAALAAGTAAGKVELPVSPWGVKFELRRLGAERTEACAVADFDGDGRPDVVAGEYLYLAPDFRPRKIREIKTDVKEDGKGYAHDFTNLAMDVDGNGKMDVVSGNWFTKDVYWFRNRLPEAGLWERREIGKPGNIETAILVDADGDGKATDLFPDCPTAPCVYRHAPGAAEPFAFTQLGTARRNMGRGCGDLDGDGRNDLIAPEEWYRQLPDGKWEAHPLDLGLGERRRKFGHASNFIVCDVNGDGLNDLVFSSAHGCGIYWSEQLKERGAGGELKFRLHAIDESWTQAHCLALGDLDGDGKPEIVTGKRFLAHNGNDPDPWGPLAIYCYTFTRGPEPKFAKHAVSVGQGVGAGVNLWLADMDGDGRLDVVTTGKFGGPVILYNRKNP